MNFYINALSTLPIVLSNRFQVTWEAPSNIALVKYWGKHGKQLPCNPSLSFSLKNSITTTTIEFKPNKSLKVNLRFRDNENEKFRVRLERFFISLGEVTHFFKNMEVTIDTDNTFPHSAGIASSASSMASIALCISSLIYNELNKEVDDSFYKLASYIARLGSGSASRSIYGKYSIWGHTNIVASSDEFAIPFTGYSSVFDSVKDAILVVSGKEKQVSSSVGHSLMDKNPFAEIRYANAQRNLSSLVDAMRKENVSKFFAIVEQEAMELHAMMMVANPSYLLMEANSLTIIKKIKEFRDQTGLNVGFTLDAGPNVHLLYFDDSEGKIRAFIESLAQFCEDGKIIFDKVGLGPKMVGISGK